MLDVPQALMAGAAVITKPSEETPVSWAEVVRGWNEIGAPPVLGCVTGRGSPGIDIRAGVGAQLAAAGVRAVSRDPRCTAETPALYSYRRDGRTGRFAGLVWLA